MRVTIFSSNQPRHIAFVEEIAGVSTDVFHLCETTTIDPGVKSDFFAASPTFAEYFMNVQKAEHRVFGNARFSSANVSTLAVKMGDLSSVKRETLTPALTADIFFVFGASYIRGWLADYLVSRGAINLHMGIAPSYRGNSCNFWALYDHQIQYVGATIHRLSHGLDSGGVLFHCLPKLSCQEINPFEFTMMAVKSAHEGVMRRVKDQSIFDLPEVPQDRAREVRYTKNEHFTESVAGEFLRRPRGIDVSNLCYTNLVEPHFYTPS